MIRRTVTNAASLRRFVGKEGKYQIPNGAIVLLEKTFPRRKCLIRYNGMEYISMVNLCRKILQ